MQAFAVLAWSATCCSASISFNSGGFCLHRTTVARIGEAMAIKRHKPFIAVPGRHPAACASCCEQNHCLPGFVMSRRE
jgi:hypothetical protein